MFIARVVLCDGSKYTFEADTAVKAIIFIADIRDSANRRGLKIVSKDIEEVRNGECFIYAKTLGREAAERANQKRCAPGVCKNCCRQNREQIESSKYNAMLHVLYLFIILHDVFGFGAIRLQRLLNAFADYNESLKNDLEDGVAWTKILKRLDEIGLDIGDFDRKYAETVMQRKYEKGVIRYTEEVK